MEGRSHGNHSSIGACSSRGRYTVGVRLPVLVLLGGAAILCAAACGRGEKRPEEAVRAVRQRLEGRFVPPADGRLTDAQIDMFLRVRKAAVTEGSDSEAAMRLTVSPAEFDWVRARILEALLALDSRQASAAVFDAYGHAIEALREARRGAVDRASAAKVEGEIAAFERERATLRRPDPLAAVVAANSARVEKRRAEIEAVAP
jgi:hypothetical protein